MKKIRTALFIALIVSTLFFSGCGNGISIKLYDGETVLRTVSVFVGSEYDFGKPEKTGYRFTGWYDARDGGNALTDGEGKSAGMTWKSDGPTNVYAHWAANTYKILFEYCGATAFDDVSEISVTYDAKITEKFPVPQKTGFSFAGWFTAEKGGVQVVRADGTLAEGFEIFSAAAYPFEEGGTVLYARWSERNITYLLMAEGKEIDRVTYPVGTVLYGLPSALKDNYCFTDWCFDQTLLSPMQYPYTVRDESEDVVMLYAKFEVGSNDVLRFDTISSTGDREYEVSYTGNAERIVIPDSYFGKKVTRVSSVDSASIREIVLPQTVTAFAEAAFKGCAALESINIPSCITELPAELFFGCEKLRAIVLPQGLTAVGNYAFSDCKTVVEIVLPGALAAIGDGAFRNMSSLQKFSFSSDSERYYEAGGVLYYKIGTSASLVQYPAGKTDESFEIPSDVTRLFPYSFAGARLRSVVIGGKINRIEEGAFDNCSSLLTVSIATQATSLTLEESVFRNCKRLKALRSETDFVPELGADAFAGTASTFAVYVPSALMRRYQTSANWRDVSDKIQSIGMIFGDYALEEVTGGYKIKQYFGTARELTVPAIINTKQIVEIGEGAFADSYMTEIVIPESIIDIGNGAFRNSAELKEIVVQGEPPALGQNAFEGISGDFGIYVDGPAELLETYKTADGWSAFQNRIWTRNES